MLLNRGMPQSAHDIQILIDRLSRFFFLAKRYSDHLHRDAPLTTGERAIVFELEERGEASVPAMADERGISRQAIQRTVDGLEASGFVRKQISKEDRRNRSVRLTAKGRRLAEHIRTVEAQEVARFPSPLGAKEIRQLNGLLDQLEGAISERLAAAAQNTKGEKE